MKLTILSLLIVLATVLTASLRDGEMPHRILVNPEEPSAGQTVTITVEMTAAVTQNTSVTITADSAFWSSIPSSVVVTQGNDDVSFQATIRQSPSGSSTVIATANGGSAHVNIPL